MFKTVSLFSGAMGLDLGLESTGEFEVLAAVEKEPSFCDTIRKNRDSGVLLGSPLVYETDIKELDAHQLMADLGLNPGELDLLVGGPPCQSFSTAGRRRTVEDPRGTLLWDFLRFIEVLQPKFFLMENVRGLISSALRHRPIADRPVRGGAPLEPEEQPGSVIQKFDDDLRTISGPYRMDIFEVNSVNYGAPQIRERALFVGSRLPGAVLSFPNPTHGPIATSSAVHQQQLSLEGDPEPVDGSSLRPWRTLRDALSGLVDADPVIQDFSPRKKRYLDLVPEGANWRSLPPDIAEESMGRAFHAKGGRSGWWRRLTWDLPSPTLVTMPNHASTSLCHPTETRALTVREYARIQEFPDDWQICGTPAEQYAQIGNAVPVRLGAVAGRVISGALHRTEVSPSQGSLPPAPGRVVYIQSHVRTRSWYREGKVAVWEGNGEAAAYAPPRTIRRERPIQS